MRWLPLPALTLALLSGGAAVATPPLSCTAPQATATRPSGDLLRQVAETCASPPLATLYYNRAYHADLLEHFRSVLRLESYHGDEDAKNYHAYRIFIALSETFAESRTLGAETPAVAWLNSVYERASDIAELRLKGYDNLADRLDRQVWTR